MLKWISTCAIALFMVASPAMAECRITLENTKANYEQTPPVVPITWEELSEAGTQAMLNVIAEFNLPTDPEIVNTVGSVMGSSVLPSAVVIFHDSEGCVTGGLNGPVENMRQRIEAAEGADS